MSEKVIAPEISVKNVSMVFSDSKGNPVQALKNVSIDIQKGEFISLLGPSGCDQGWQEISHNFLQFAEFTLTIDDAKEYVYSLSTKRRVYNWNDIRVRLYI